MPKIDPDRDSARSALLRWLIAEHKRPDDAFTGEADDTADRRLAAPAGQVRDVMASVRFDNMGSPGLPIPVGDTRVPGIRNRQEVSHGRDSSSASASTYPVNR